MQKLILDTDIGSDIDDVMCLSYLLAQPECDLLGVTTVSGEPWKRAEIADALCKRAGKDVPVFPGIEQPLLGKQFQPHAPQHSKVGNWAHRNFPPGNAGKAIEFLRDTIRANPGEVTLLTIGPLTNIAALFSIDREIPSMLKELVMMGGCFTRDTAHTPLAEWNILCDPHAAQIVIGSPIPRLRMVGIDMTARVVMERDEVRRRCTAPLLETAVDFAEVWFEHSGSITFHDPLASAVIFEPDICPFARGYADVELQSERLAGVTHWAAAEDGPHEVASSVDVGRFFEHYFGVFD